MPDSLLFNQYHLDSLKMVGLEHRIDSLADIVDKTAIGQGFFSDVISSQANQFIAIIGLFAFIAWGSLFAYLKSQQLKLAKEHIKFKRLVFEEIEKENTIHEKRFEKLFANAKKQNYNIASSMLSHAKQIGSYIGILSWRIRCAIDGQSIEKKKVNLAQFHLQKATEVLTLIINEGKTIDESLLKEMITALSEITVKFPEVELEREKLLKKLNHCLYSKA